MDKPRTALVLEGGGAKGAYTLGMLKVLKEEGIHFDVVCGTSVGALNGFLWAADKIDWGEKFWSELTIDDVCEIKLPGFVGKIYFGLVFVARLLREQSGLNSTHPFWPRFLPSGIVRWIIPMFVFQVIWLIFLGFRIDPIFFALDVLLVLVAMPFFLIGKLIRVATDRGLVVANNNALRSRIDELVKGVELKIPLYTTHSLMSDCWHPRLRYRELDDFGGAPQYMASELYMPEYSRFFDQESISDLGDALEVSALLPYGYFTSQDLYVDGGLSDNVPIWPAVALEHCERILVLRLDSEVLKSPVPYEGEKEKDLGYWLDQTDELMRSKEIKPIGVQRGNDPSPSESLPKSKIVVSPNIMVIEPGEKLGGFFSGTVNFDKASTGAWLVKGRAKALEKIEEIRGFLGQ